MKKLFFITSVIAIVMLSSCGIKEGYLKFQQIPDELIAPEKIRAFLKQNPNPSIVLRVPQTTAEATQQDPNSHLYTAIEKELVLQGFNLKDRGLFNQVLNSQKDLDYSKITDLTGTDLILELVKVDTKIPFNTNKAYTKKDIEIILKDINYLRYGASIEFKLILVKNNEHGGSYTFTLTPCTELNDDCRCKVPYKFGKKFYSEFLVNICRLNELKEKNAPPTAYESIPQPIIENFVRDGVKKVVEAIKQ
jgi:hypothetical protein